jgi:hypothetical protein
MPKLSMTMEEGDQVRAGDVLCEVNSDKVEMEVESRPTAPWSATPPPRATWSRWAPPSPCSPPRPRTCSAGCWARRRAAELDVSFDGDRLLLHKRVNVGIAVAVDGGLVVLAVGAVLPEPVATDDGLQVHRRMRLTLSIDHRPSTAPPAPASSSSSRRPWSSPCRSSPDRASRMARRPYGIYGHCGVAFGRWRAPLTS